MSRFKAALTLVSIATLSAACGGGVKAGAALSPKR